MKDIIVVGNFSNKSAPGTVALSLIKGLKGDGITVKSINTGGVLYGKILALLKICGLLFVRNKIINVHSFGYLAPYIVCLISSLNKSNDYYLTLHGITSIENKINRKEYNSVLERKLIKGFPNIICVSNLEKELLATRFGRQKNVVVVYNGVDMNVALKKKATEYHGRTGRVGIIMAGGFSRRKNTMGVIKFAEYAMSRKVLVSIVICGNIEDENYYDDCCKYIKTHGLEESITILGKLTPTKLNEAYTENDYVIALSKFDTFNLTVLEGMRCGLPAIVSKNSGVSEILDGSGLVVSDNDYSSILDFISNSKYNSISDKAYMVGQTYSIKKMTEDYLRLFGGLR